MRMMACSIAVTQSCIAPFLIMGSHVARLEHLQQHPTSTAHSQLQQPHPALLAFTSSLQALIAHIRASMHYLESQFCLESQPLQSDAVLAMAFAIQPLAATAEAVARVCKVAVSWDSTSATIVPLDGNPQHLHLPHPSLLLSRLFEAVTFAQTSTCSHPYPIVERVLVSLFEAVAKPFAAHLAVLVALPLGGTAHQSGEHDTVRFLNAFQSTHTTKSGGFFLDFYSARMRIQESDCMPAFIPAKLVDSVRHSGFCLDLLRGLSPNHLVFRDGLVGGGFGIAVVVCWSDAKLMEKAVAHYLDEYMQHVYLREDEIRQTVERVVHVRNEQLKLLDLERKTTLSAPKKALTPSPSILAKKRSWRLQVTQFLSNLAAQREVAALAQAQEQALALSRARNRLAAETALRDAERVSMLREFERKMDALEVKAVQVEFDRARLARKGLLRELYEKERGLEDEFLRRESAGLVAPINAKEEKEVGIGGVIAEVRQQDKQQDSEVRQKQQQDSGEFQGQKQDTEELGGGKQDLEEYSEAVGGEISVSIDASMESGVNLEDESSFVSALDISQTGGGDMVEDAAVEPDILEDELPSEDISSLLDSFEVPNSDSDSDEPNGDVLDGLNDAFESISEREKLDAVVESSRPVASLISESKKLLVKEISNKCACHGVVDYLCPSTAFPVANSAFEVMPLEIVLDRTLYRCIYARCDLISRETLLVLVRNLKLPALMESLGSAFFLKDTLFTEYIIALQTQTSSNNRHSFLQSALPRGPVCDLLDGPNPSLRLVWTSRARNVQRVSLRYTPKQGALEYVFPATLLAKYERVFDLLMEARQCLFLLHQSVPLAFSRDRRLQQRSRSSTTTGSVTVDAGMDSLILRFRMEAFEFVSNLLRYFHELGLAPWMRFMQLVARIGRDEVGHGRGGGRISDLKALERAHASALTRVEWFLLLSKVHEPVLRLLRDVFGAIESICGVIRAGTGGAAVPMDAGVLRERYRSLREKIEIFVKVVDKMKGLDISAPFDVDADGNGEWGEGGYSCLESLLLFVNYNHYYAR
ncbi:hypothetical protein HDU78_003447 [Chytriomyces hyalinus]|nr:hypothetical protein HDU78_003447 [Chytriomyces hyalinus]